MGREVVGWASDFAGAVKDGGGDAVVFLRGGQEVSVWSEKRRTKRARPAWCLRESSSAVVVQAYSRSR